MSVRVGACGFAEARDTIFADVSMLEVRKAFYQPPKVETAERWRQKAPSDFVFTLKAWQLITHETSSPTYRRLRESLSDAERARCGRLRWNETTQMAWRRTQAIADALDAGAVLFQTPKSFEPTDENLRNLRTFLSNADRRDRHVVFEPRGDAWTDDLVADLAHELDLVHGVDPFLRSPTTSDLRYFRLHGRPAYEYGYSYTADDLADLQARLPSGGPAWVFFNNRTMADDARALQRRLADE